MVIVRSRISYAYLLRSEMDSLMSITILNLTDRPIQLACGDILVAMTTPYTVRPAGNKLFNGKIK